MREAVDRFTASELLLLDSFQGLCCGLLLAVVVAPQHHLKERDGLTGCRSNLSQDFGCHLLGLGGYGEGGVMDKAEEVRK